MIPDQEDPLEKGLATYSRILTWRVPWMRSLGGYSPSGHKESGRTEETEHTHTHTHTQPHTHTHTQPHTHTHTHTQPHTHTHTHTQPHTHTHTHTPRHFIALLNLKERLLYFIFYGEKKNFPYQNTGKSHEKNRHLIFDLFVKITTKPLAVSLGDATLTIFF